MKQAILTGVILTGGLFAGACSDTDGTLAKHVSDVVEVTDVELVLPSSGKSVESTIITSDNPWTIEGGSDWCTFSPRAGGPGTTTVYFTLLPNETHDDRSVILTLHSPAGDQTLTIYQKKKDAIIFSKDRFDNIAMDGGEIEVELQANVEYRVDVPAANAWIQHQPGTRTRGLEARKESFRVGSTEDFNPRKGIIVFVNLENEKMRDTVTIYQVQRDQIILEATSARVPLEGETIKIPVRSNIVYEVNIPTEITWVHVEASNRADEIVLRVEESSVDRSATIAIRDKNNHALSSPFTIEQQEKETLKFQAEDAEVSREGGKIKLVVLENLGGKYQLIIPEYAPWIKLSTPAANTRALTPGEIWIEIEENGVDDLAREGRVFAQGTENTDLLAVFVIRQAGGRAPESDERVTLLKVADALGGLGSWQNNWQESWQITRPLNTWTGVETDPTGQHVVTLSLSTQARGQLPKEIGDLSYLETLRLEVSPNISGVFPPQIANLKSLRSLTLSGGKFEGIIPEFGALTAMKNLKISGGFSGQPGAYMDAIGWLENLETLEITSGKYGDAMPGTWGNLKKLQSLTLDNANFSNIDPVGGMTALHTLSVSYMPELTGNLPESFGNLKELVTLKLYHTGISGLPLSLGNLEKLNTLYIYETKITTIPSSAENLKALRALTLSRNELTALPEALSGMINLTTLQVDGNPNLAGELPVDIGNLNKLTRLLINNNPLLGGPIPESISRLQGITSLNLQGNAFTTLPQSIGEMVNLTEIFLQGNDFQGTIPESIGNLKKLDALYINRPEKTPYKGLTGPLPASLGTIETLRYVLLENNQLSGEIPETFSGLKKLHTMKLSNNELTGSLPGLFSSLPNLTVLLLENNGLSGSLPVDFRDFTSIQQLNLYNNNFEGTIPEGFQGKQLSYSASTAILDLRMNKLRGKIPDTFLVRTADDTVHFKYREQKPGFGFDN
jgi:Leucine-rich repeat (LRR) protein